jgi:hypothetical protein
MKSAPLVAGSALGLLLLALATANPFAPLRKVVPLDFTGIDTVEFHGAEPQIQISSSQAAQVSYMDNVDRTLDVRRSGSRLVITAPSREYFFDVQLNVPASVRMLDVQGARIVAKERLQSMQVSSSKELTWDGDIARLDLRDTADHSKHTVDDDDCSCDGTSFTLSDGHIDELVVRSSHGHLRLNESDKIDAVYAWLGEKGNVSLEKARRFDNIHLLHTEAQLQDATGPKPPTNPGP